MTALGAASANDRPSATRRHANEEAVCAFAANNRRLVGAFHDMALDFVAERNVRLDIARALFVKLKILFLSFLWITFLLRVRISNPRLYGFLRPIPDPGSLRISTGRASATLSDIN